MAYLRFHRGIRLLPGLRLNLSKSGPSLSLGVNGCRVNVGTQGVRTTVGIPGSGLSVIERKSWQTLAGEGAAKRPRSGRKPAADPIPSLFEGLSDADASAKMKQFVAGLSDAQIGKTITELDAQRASYPQFSDAEWNGMRALYTDELAGRAAKSDSKRKFFWSVVALSFGLVTWATVSTGDPAVGVLVAIALAISLPVLTAVVYVWKMVLFG